MTSIEVNLVGVFIDNSKHAQVIDLVVSLLPMKKWLPASILVLTLNLFSRSGFVLKKVKYFCTNQLILFLFF